MWFGYPLSYNSTGFTSITFCMLTTGLFISPQSYIIIVVIKFIILAPSSLYLSLKIPIIFKLLIRGVLYPNLI